jgi:S1-C subfamily serine protease
MTHHFKQIAALFFVVVLGLTHARAQDETIAEIVAKTQPKVVKIYGAGGLRGLEAFQTGSLISPQGHILTIWSYVLDAEDLNVTLVDGRKFKAELLAADPKFDAALLKIEGEEFPAFTMQSSTTPKPGDRALSFINLYGIAVGNQAVSVVRSRISAIGPLSTRRGGGLVNYDGDVLYFDAVTSNPGAQGGPVIDRRGNLIGMIGKETRNSSDSTWANYAIPASALAPVVDDLISGKARPRDTEEKKLPKNPFDIEAAGIVLAPNVVARTPPFVNRVIPKSSAAEAGVLADDLILFVNGQLASSRKAVEAELKKIDRRDRVKLTLQRGGKILEVELVIDE